MTECDSMGLEIKIRTRGKRTKLTIRLIKIILFLSPTNHQNRIKSCVCNHSVSSRSRRRRDDVAATKIVFEEEDVSATSLRPSGDLKKSPKSRRKNRTYLISPRLPRDTPL